MTHRRPSEDEVHRWIRLAYREPKDPAQVDAPRFTRWNMEVAYCAGWAAALVEVEISQRQTRTRRRPLLFWLLLGLLVGIWIGAATQWL